MLAPEKKNIYDRHNAKTRTTSRTPTHVGGDLFSGTELKKNLQQCVELIFYMGRQ